MGRSKKTDVRFVKFTITAPEGWVKRLSEFCQRHGYTKSEAVRVAVREFMERHERGEDDGGGEGQ